MTLLEGAGAAGAPDLCELPVSAARGLYRQILPASGGCAVPRLVRSR
ncbi:MAG: hypothetical protein JNL87_18150 [Burkholderiaceae bacterium]|nr:hypothetical protein [Burkholderiaceae bacterium]